MLREVLSDTRYVFPNKLVLRESRARCVRSYSNSLGPSSCYWGWRSGSGRFASPWSSCMASPINQRVTSMSLQLKICQDARGAWSVHGLSPAPMSGLPSLSACIDYARKACDAAPATIELLIDGMYIVVRQERGWPRSLFGPKPCEIVPNVAGPNLKGPPARGGSLTWLKRVIHLAPGTSRIPAGCFTTLRPTR